MGSFDALSGEGEVEEKIVLTAGRQKKKKGESLPGAREGPSFSRKNRGDSFRGGGGSKGKGTKAPLRRFRGDRGD